MAGFVVVKTIRRDLGRSGFLQVQRAYLSEDPARSTFIVLTRGHKNEKARDHWERFATLPDEPHVLSWLANQLGRF